MNNERTLSFFFLFFLLPRNRANSGGMASFLSSRFSQRLFSSSCWISLFSLGYFTIALLLNSGFTEANNNNEAAVAFYVTKDQTNVHTVSLGIAKDDNTLARVGCSFSYDSSSTSEEGRSKTPQKPVSQLIEETTKAYKGTCFERNTGDWTYKVSSVE